MSAQRNPETRRRLDDEYQKAIQQRRHTKPKPVPEPEYVWIPWFFWGSKTIKQPYGDAYAWWPE